MDEPRRRAYLDALGIPLWVPRVDGPAGSAERSDASQLSTTAGDNGTAPSTEEMHRPAGDVAALDWSALRERVAACTACALHATRRQTVFGVGSQQARLMVIGEAPGADEDRQGEPFVGRAGQLLDAMLRAIGLERGKVYIANVLKCRPPSNRNPSLEEAAACEGFLRRQIELIGPRLILSVGGISARNLLGTDQPVGRLRGTIHRYGGDGVPVVVTYHPAYLLRQPDEKAKAWQDLQLVARLLRDS